MDSLRVLRDSLDSSRPPGGASKRNEKRLNHEFKAAALHLTNLYRNSLASSQSSHRSGYVQGLRDILDLILLRSSQQAASNTTADHWLEESVEGELEDDIPGPSARSSSHAELRWLVRYLRARIDAIKSESDEDEMDAESDVMNTQPPHSSSAISSDRFASQPQTGAGGQHQLPSRRATSFTPGCSVEPDDHRQASPASSVPNTPAPRSQKIASRPARHSIPARTPSASDRSGNGHAPSSSFSFSVPSASSSSPNTEAHAGTSPAMRRKTKALSTAFALGAHTRSSSNSASLPTPLSPVGEETRARPLSNTNFQTVEESDIDMRESRGNGRRGPLPRTEGEKPKRRKRGPRQGSHAAGDDGSGEGSGASAPNEGQETSQFSRS